MAIHSKNFLTIKRGYQTGTWSKQRVYNVVNKPNGITPTEYEEITGEVYE